MSHVEAGIYRGPRPDCIYCKGTGIRKVRRAHEEGWDVVSERCACTDPRPQSRAQAGRTPQGSEEKQGAERLRRKKTREREERMSETQKDNRTQEWAERVGREAVLAGVPWRPGMFEGGTVGMRVLEAFPDADALELHFAHGEHGESNWTEASDATWPDFRDRITELACIAWVEDVAREVYEERELAIEFGWEFGPVEYVKIYVWLGGEDMTGACRAPTLAEACIAAVCAMKGGE